MSCTRMVSDRVAGGLRRLGALVCVSVGLAQLAACQGTPGEQEQVVAGRAQALTENGAIVEGFWLSNQDQSYPSGFSISEGYELGIRFKTTYTGTGATIRGIRLYRRQGITSGLRVSLWSETGQLVARTTGTQGTISNVEWQEVRFPSPVAIESGKTYTASYYIGPGGEFGHTNPYFTQTLARDYLEAAPGAGVYGPDGGAPTNVYSSVNYWVDPVLAIPCAATPPSGGTPATFNLLGNETPLLTSSDPAPVELGVKFRTNGTKSVTAIRFYKSAGNTGTHTATLWNEAGGSLGTATFTSETATGWQTATFSSPIPVTAGQTYIASYLAPNGNWSYTLSGLSEGRGTSTDNLYAPPAHTVGGNGVFRFGGGFPNGTYAHTNYFVDVVVVETASACGGSTPPPPPPPSTGTANIFGDVTPAVPAYSHDAPVELGVKFKTNGTRSVTGIRFYKGAGNDGPHVGSLWDAFGNLLAQATFTNETATGWQSVTFPSPVAVTAGQTYVASYYAPVGHWAYEAGGMVNGKGAPSDPVYAPSDASAGGNAVYVFGGGFPSESAGGSHYYVDVVVTADGGSSPPPPPPSTSTVNMFGDVTPAVPAYSHDAPVELGVKFKTSGTRSVTGIRFYKGAGNDGPHIGSLWDAAGNLLAEATFTNETATGWQSVTFPSAVAVTAGQTYVASYYAPAGHWAYEAGGLDRGRGAPGDPVYAPSDASAGGNAVYVFGGGFPYESSGGGHYYVDVMVTTDGGASPPPPSSTVNMFGDVTPAVPAYDHDAPVELGVKFKTSGTRSVTGIRFYKGAGNDGPHIGSLWDAAGNLLAQATFTNETATGWQTVTFTSPVAVTAGQTYVASYYAPMGHWAYEYEGLAEGKGATSDAVYAPSDASAGGNAVYVFGGGFPSESAGGSHYYVDVMVTP
jgi:hypothetical protein